MNEQAIKTNRQHALTWLAARQIDAKEYQGGLVISAMNKYYPGGWDGFCLGQLSVA